MLSSILRYLFYSRSFVPFKYVSFVTIFRSFPHIFERFVPILMAFYLFSRFLFYSRSSNVSFLPILERFVPILMVFYLFVKYLFYCNSSHVSFVPFVNSFVNILDRFVPILSLLLFDLYIKNVRSTKSETKIYLNFPRGGGRDFCTYFEIYCS